MDLENIACGLGIGYTTCIRGVAGNAGLAMRYDASEEPHSQTWLDLDESERIDLVIDYHRRTGVKLENANLHAMAHVVVENQVALGAPPVPETLGRLVQEGLDRHEAIHAIGSVLMGIVFDIVRKADDGGDINAKYSRELSRLTAVDWRSQMGGHRKPRRLRKRRGGGLGERRSRIDN